MLAFWDYAIGKMLFSDTVYEHAVKKMKVGKRNSYRMKALGKGTKSLISLFDNH